MIELLTLFSLIFTFDDGPRVGTTEKILDTLKDNNIKAIFCIPVGNLYSSKRLLIAQRILREGHTICNHSFSHPVFSKISPIKQRWEIRYSQQIFREKLGVTPRYFRPPCGVITSVMRSEVRLLGMTILMWDIDSRDWKPRTSQDDIIKNVLAGKKKYPNKIQTVLFHDTNKKTASILQKLIDELKAKR